MAPGLHEAMRPERPGTMVRDDGRLGVRRLRHGVRPRAAPPSCATSCTTTRPATSTASRRTGSRRSSTRSPRARSGSRRSGPRTRRRTPRLWRYLLDLDLARSFRLWSAPLDEPLRHLVTDARAVNTSITDNLYVRVVDVVGGPHRPEVRRRRGPGHRGRRPDPRRTTAAATGSSPTATRRLDRRGHPGDLEAGPVPGDPRARDGLPRRRTAGGPAPRRPGHRAHPRCGGGRLDGLRLAPGAVVPRHVLSGEWGPASSRPPCRGASPGRRRRRSGRRGAARSRCPTSPRRRATRRAAACSPRRRVLEQELATVRGRPPRRPAR